MRGYGSMGMMSRAPAAPTQEEIRKAAAALRDAADEEAKAEATQELTELLETYFDQDMQRREEELAKIEERLRNLRAQLERRQAKKQEIIDLQIQVAVNEAEGLGFFSQPAEGGGRYLYYWDDEPAAAASATSIGPPALAAPPVPPTPVDAPATERP